MNSLTLTIDGRFIAKKNSRRSLKNRRTGKMFSAPSEAFEAYKVSAIRQIKNQTRKQIRYEVNLLDTADLIGRVSAPQKLCEVPPPYRVDYLFNVKGKGRIDVDNAMASINDILQEAGIIDDDTNILEGFFEKSMGQK